MKIPAIKKAVDAYTIEQLATAEAALYDEQTLAIDIDGEDEGEQLTHILAAKFIKEKMAEGMEYNTALREYSKRVRSSIS